MPSCAPHPCRRNDFDGAGLISFRCVQRATAHGSKEHTLPTDPAGGGGAWAWLCGALAPLPLGSLSFSLPRPASDLWASETFCSPVPWELAASTYWAPVWGRPWCPRRAGAHGAACYMRTNFYVTRHPTSCTGLPSVLLGKSLGYTVIKRPSEKVKGWTGWWMHCLGDLLCPCRSKEGGGFISEGQVSIPVATRA